jgi:hypothetical protein
VAWEAQSVGAVAQPLRGVGACGRLGLWRGRCVAWEVGLPGLGLGRLHLQLAGDNKSVECKKHNFLYIRLDLFIFFVFSVFIHHSIFS